VQEGLLGLCFLTEQLIVKDIYMHRDGIFNTSCDLTSFERYRPSGMLIYRQKSYAPRGKRRTCRREDQSREIGQQSKILPVNAKL
jgi:hypothetical protein